MMEIFLVGIIEPSFKHVPNTTWSSKVQSSSFTPSTQKLQRVEDRTKYWMEDRMDRMEDMMEDRMEDTVKDWMEDMEEDRTEDRMEDTVKDKWRTRWRTGSATNLWPLFQFPKSTFLCWRR